MAALPTFVVAFDLPDASSTQRGAFREVLCEHLVGGERRLRTVWRGLAVHCDDAEDLEAAILSGVESHRKLGQSFAANNLRMMVVMADEDSSCSVSEHRTKTFESCP